MTEKDWLAFKKRQIDSALKACEKYGYPTSDEPLCCLIDDILDNAKDEIEHFVLKETSS